MNYEEIQSYIKLNLYLDARIKVLNCEYFGNEVVLIHEYKNGKDVKLNFLECCEITMQHDKHFEKAIEMKNATYAQIPYFIQNIKMSEREEELYYICIDAYPLDLEIVCKKVVMTLINKVETSGLKCKEFRW